MSKTYIGIDPGKTPSICRVDFDGNILMNTLLKGNDDFPYQSYLSTLKINVGLRDIICVELPHSVFGASAKSNFVFGASVGACLQGTYATEGNMFTVAPKAWQKVIIKPQDVVTNEVKGKMKRDTKATAERAARRILGDRWDDNHFLPTSRSSVINHNMIDSFLIAEYCRQMDK